ncbi:MAG: CopD family protein [Acidobacteria bacterium]|nr:CopD family protein [Acidobacteriota bacterium]
MTTRAFPKRDSDGAAAPQVQPRAHHRRLRRSGFAVGLSVLFALVPLLWPAAAGAHAELESTDPENLSTVTEPVSEIRFTFTKASEPVEERFSVEGPDGAVPIDSVESLDGGLVVLARLAEPATAGRYRVGWGIRAGDSHSMNGAISFTVEGTEAVTPVAPAPVAPSSMVPAPSSTVPAPTSSLVSGGSGVADDGTGIDAAGGRTDIEPVTDEPVTDEPLGAVAGATEERAADAVRGLLYLGLLGAVGGVAYLAAVYRGARSESRGIVAIVRGAAVSVGVLAVGAALVEVVVGSGGSWGSLLDPTAWTDGLAGGFGVATLLRLLGAAAVAWFVAGSIERVRMPSPEQVDGTEGTPGVSAPSADPGGSGGVATAQRVVRRRRNRDDVVRVVPSPLAWLGVAALLASETFTGHTAATEPRWLIAPSDVTHLAGAGVWAAGAALLCWTFWQRSRVRPGDPLAGSVLRFSTLAGWALLAVTVTGVIQGGLILGSVGALTSTTFGRVLALKVLVVAAIAWTGWWNRRHLVPEFEDGAPSSAAVRQLRMSLTAETVGFLVVVALTAVLVVSSPV